MTFLFPPGQQGDNEETTDSADAEQALHSGEQVTAGEHLSAEAQLSPVAQGETNGGPLGCCLGVTVGLLLSLSVAILSRFYAEPLAQVFHSGLSITVRIVMFIIAIAGATLCGYIGWKIGKRLYKEYDLSPRQQRRLAHLEQRQMQRQARRH